MPATLRASLFGLVGMLCLGQTACSVVPEGAYRQAQMQSYQFARQNRSYAARNQHLAQQKNSLEDQLRIADQRITNLKDERQALKQRYLALLKGGKNPLSDATTRRFEELARKYPEFEFDPTTGVSKFSNDILFASGSAGIRKQAIPLLREFAEIMNDGAAGRLNILVVGHTDDRPIVKKATHSRHPSNWHLSTNRGNSVVLALAKAGISQSRMGVAGYSMFQPVVANKDDSTRQRNRRVEIYVLAPDAAIAGWDPHSSRN